MAEHTRERERKRERKLTRRRLVIDQGAHLGPIIIIIIITIIIIIVVKSCYFLFGLDYKHLINHFRNEKKNT